MTPAARLSAAIEVLDRWLAGTPAERALTDWGRASRYAGSSDRAAIRDLVYDALRRRRSAAWIGGTESGRGGGGGLARLAGTDPATLFTGERFAPAPVTAGEVGSQLAEAPAAVRLDCPDWLFPLFGKSLGADAERALEALRHRAPVWLRVNTARTDRAAVIDSLAAEGIGAVPHRDINTALKVTDNARKIASSRPYVQGLVELQDASSQSVVAALGSVEGLAVLDYCAGAGGKALHLAAEGARVTAHDVDRARMRDLAPRAARAGVVVATATTGALKGNWPLILVDAPCSGSGTWRRDPEGKWRLTPDRLAELTRLQDRVLDNAARLIAPGGRIGYVTCSILDEENVHRIEAFLARHPDWLCQMRRRLLPDACGDGFGIAILRRI